MLRNWNKNFYIFILLLVLLSCNKDKPPIEPIPSGEEYYPLKIGKYINYNVKQYFGENDLGLTDTSIYQLKEILTDTFRDLEGRLAYRIERYTRKDSSSKWNKIDSIWSVNKTIFNIQKVESNRRFLKLIFPVKEGKQWNANLYNDLSNESSISPYQYGKPGIPATYGGINFPETVHIIQANTPNIISETKKGEYYAKNIGMIYKYNIDINFDQQNFTDTISGIIYYQEIIDYGPK